MFRAEGVLGDVMEECLKEFIGESVRFEFMDSSADPRLVRSIISEDRCRAVKIPRTSHGACWSSKIVKTKTTYFGGH